MTDAGRRRWLVCGLSGLALVAGAGAILDIRGSKPTGDGRAARVATVLSADPVTTGSPARVDYARLDARIARLMQDPDMVGLAVGTVENGRVRFVRGYGEVLAGSGVPVTRDTAFRWASVSKGVAASVIAKLAEEGRLSLGAPVAALGTTLRLPGASAGVTVADVLSHRTGLVRNAWDDRLEAGEDPRALRAAMGELSPLCPPSTCHAYQNIAFDTASEIVGRATGGDYAGVAGDRLFKPLGMTRASFGRAGLQARDWARPHRLGRRSATVDDAYYRVPAAGGVNSSIDDLVRWMRAQMGAAPGVLSPGVLRTMQAPRVATPPRGRRSAMDRALTDPGYGLGWRNVGYAGRRLVGHRGSVDGYGALVLFDPADRSGIAMLWNSNGYKAARLQLEFFDGLYGLPPTDWLELDASPVGVTDGDRRGRMPPCAPTSSPCSPPSP